MALGAVRRGYHDPQCCGDRCGTHACRCLQLLVKHWGKCAHHLIELDLSLRMGQCLPPSTSVSHRFALSEAVAEPQGNEPASQGMAVDEVITLI